MATKAELQAALDAANAERGADNQIVPEGSNKGDLEAALTKAGVEVVETEKAKATYVLAPLVQVTFGNRVLHFYRGDLLPEGAGAESLANLTQLGYVGSADELTK